MPAPKDQIKYVEWVKKLSNSKKGIKPKNLINICGWNKGLKGVIKPNKTSFKKGQIPHNFGTAKKRVCKVCGKEFRVSKSKVYCSWNCYLKDEHKNNQVNKITSEETRIKQSCIKRGIDTKYFDKFLRPLNKQIRNLNEYKDWRYKVFKRDNFTCQHCGNNKCYLEAHHLDRLSDIIIENNINSIYDAKDCVNLWNINIGITLCRDCHKKIHLEELK